ncbi:hypothetical protein [Mesorhizobium sp. CA7]|uniref:hypothetical protein n=1 Tax=Mesorhizobium sp. CA7 TaxID=588501 RepID=UPI001CCDEDEE|nr:hypothetical protein [Mesorhizobium sp. CA7]MBZ9812484.1 hypothetical protein [Mesorhizobium sp. CA7]
MTVYQNELLKKAKIELIEELNREFITMACAIAMAKSVGEVKGRCLSRDTTEEIADEIFKNVCGEHDVAAQILMKLSYSPVTREDAADILSSAGVMADFLDRFETTEAA